MQKEYRQAGIELLLLGSEEFLDGEASMSSVVMGTLNRHSDSFTKLNLQPNYITALTFYSLKRLVQYNLSLADHSNGLIFHEDFLVHPEKLIWLLGADLADNQSLEAPTTASHKQQTFGYDFLQTVKPL